MLDHVPVRCHLTYRFCMMVTTGVLASTEEHCVRNAGGRGIRIPQYSTSCPHRRPVVIDRLGQLHAPWSKCIQDVFPDKEEDDSVVAIRGSQGAMV